MSARALNGTLETESPTPRPWYLNHFSDEADGAVYMLRVTTDPLLALRALGVLEREIGRVMQFAATDARAQGATWNDVAEALQVSRQSAHAPVRRRGHRAQLTRLGH